MATTRVTVNVQGQTFTTYLATLQKSPVLEMLHRHTPDLFLDEDPARFQIVLNLLRNPQCASEYPAATVANLADQYQIPAIGKGEAPTWPSTKLSQKYSELEQWAYGKSPFTVDSRFLTTLEFYSAFFEWTPRLNAIRKYDDIYAVKLETDAERDTLARFIDGIIEGRITGDPVAKQRW